MNGSKTLANPDSETTTSCNSELVLTDDEGGGSGISLTTIYWRGLERSWRLCKIEYLCLLFREWIINVECRQTSALQNQCQLFVISFHWHQSQLLFGAWRLSTPSRSHSGLPLKACNQIMSCVDLSQPSPFNSMVQLIYMMHNKSCYKRFSFKPRVATPLRIQCVKFNSQLSLTHSLTGLLAAANWMTYCCCCWLHSMRESHFPKFKGSKNGK